MFALLRHKKKKQKQFFEFYFPVDITALFFVCYRKNNERAYTYALGFLLTLQGRVYISINHYDDSCRPIGVIINYYLTPTHFIKNTI